jgi:transcriptional regulator with GAF, ATPase, and Fis domain
LGESVDISMTSCRGRAAASNRDLSAEVAARHFREDLFYRLNVIALHVRPLRERAEDILPLADRLLSAAAVPVARRVAHLGRCRARNDASRVESVSLRQQGPLHSSVT